MKKWSEDVSWFSPCSVFHRILQTVIFYFWKRLSWDIKFCFNQQTKRLKIATVQNFTTKMDSYLNVGPLDVINKTSTLFSNRSVCISWTNNWKQLWMLENMIFFKLILEKQHCIENMLFVLSSEIWPIMAYCAVSPRAAEGKYDSHEGFYIWANVILKCLLKVKPEKSGRLETVCLKDHFEVCCFLLCTYLGLKLRYHSSWLFQGFQPRTTLFHLTFLMPPWYVSTNSCEWLCMRRAQVYMMRLTRL